MSEILWNCQHRRNHPLSHFYESSFPLTGLSSRQNLQVKRVPTSCPTVASCRKGCEVRTHFQPFAEPPLPLWRPYDSWFQHAGMPNFRREYLRARRRLRAAGCPISSIWTVGCYGRHRPVSVPPISHDLFAWCCYTKWRHGDDRQTGSPAWRL